MQLYKNERNVWLFFSLIFMRGLVMKLNKTIEIAISTYNRARILENWINGNYRQLSECGFRLSIYDSSTNDETEKLINSLNKQKNFPEINYVRKDSSIRIDEKVLQSILESSADYIWPLSDSVGIDAEDIKNKVIPFLERDYEFVCVFGSTKLDNDGKTYTRPIDFFSDCFWHATWLGGIIFNKDVFVSLKDEATYQSMLNKFNRNDGFSYLGIFFEIIADRKIKAAFTVIRTDGTIGKNKVQGWLKRYMEVWCDNLIYFVDSIPAYYNPQKEKVLKETWKILDLDGTWGYKARVNGSLSKEIYEHYDQLGYLNRVLEDKTRIKMFATLPKIFVKPYYLFTEISRKIVRRMKK